MCNIEKVKNCSQKNLLRIHLASPDDFGEQPSNIILRILCQGFTIFSDSASNSMYCQYLKSRYPIHPNSRGGWKSRQTQAIWSPPAGKMQRMVLSQASSSFCHLYELFCFLFSSRCQGFRMEHPPNRIDSSMPSSF